ncbi:unnamed protein product, partial [Lepidochelys olivacea]
MASALTVLFLSCWLAVHSGAWEGREYPKPTVWVSPSRVVAVGGSVTIRCEGSYLGLEFVLPKAGHPNPQVQTVPDGTVAEFPIPSVGREDGGSYTCEYHSITDENRWSYVSDPIEIIVGELWVPRGWGCSVSHVVSPGLRGNCGPLWKGIQEPVPRATGSDPPLRLRGEDGPQDWVTGPASHGLSASPCRAQLPQTQHLPEPQRGGLPGGSRGRLVLGAALGCGWRSGGLLDTVLGWDPGDLAQLLAQPQTLCDESTSR